MINQKNPANGSLLISEPFMLDPNFKRSVVLLAEHSPDGTLGFVLNQRSDFLVNELMLDCHTCLFPVFIGGPVDNNTLHFIHRCYDKLEGIEIRDGIYWGGDFEKLKKLINDNQIQLHEVRFFVGYSGWGNEQLENELLQNSWLVSNEYSADAVFAEDEEHLWKELVISMGPKFAHIANFPENPMWN
ncbi:MAG: YqgE/AlgH family protein [Flavobacterium sp.]|nr:YqgE/AlgH family protein [Pedobacter sp.]